MRRLSVVGLLLVAPLGLAYSPFHGGRVAVAQEGERAAYRSPYRVEFSWPREELIGDLERTERGDRRLEADVPPAEWYSHRVRERFGAWGPKAREYPAPRGVEGWTVEQKRERVIAVAMRFVGYAYQHHHVPDWDPPRGWPWKPTCAGRNGRGVDCSNFTGFVYNQGFGLRINTAVGHQAEERYAEGPGRERTPLHRVELPESYRERVAALRSGDLLYIRNRSGEISHVVLWVGPIGRSPDDVPLILDSHGEDVRDSEGKSIPCGIHLRPFRENSWYNHSASHALRVFVDR